MLGQNQGSIPTCTLNSFNQMIQDAGQKNFTERHLEKRDKHKESARNLAKKNKLITISRQVNGTKNRKMFIEEIKQQKIKRSQQSIS